jgi:hypothetical protein
MCCDCYRDNTSTPVATSHFNDRLSDTFGVKLPIRELRLNGSRTLSKKKPKKAEIGAPCGITFSRVSTRCRVKAKDDARRSTIKINAGTRFRSLTFCHDAIEIKGLAATKKNPEHLRTRGSLSLLPQLRSSGLAVGCRGDNAAQPAFSNRSFNSCPHHMPFTIKHVVNAAAL